MAGKPKTKSKASPPKPRPAKAAPVRAPAARTAPAKAPPPKAPPLKAPPPKTAARATTPERPLAKAPPKVAAKPHQARAAFPKKNQPPSETEFSARLPLALGKRFETVRAFLKKQPGVTEDFYFYGPKTGWAYRYVRGPQSVCSIVIHDERLMGIVALDAAAQTAIVWEGLSDVAQKARRVAHGSPALLWIDVPFDGTGAKDFQALLKGKLRTLPPGAT
jgi:hypothetical protein